MSYIKDFIGWHNLKVKIESGDKRPTFKEREIWWCSIGINVGHETDGKTPGKYNRPVLVVRKFNNQLFWGIPLTTKIKCSPFYVPINYKGIDQCVMITQLKLWDSKRLTDIEGSLSQQQFKKVKQALKDLL